jgi:triacylglycerol lipase
VTRPYTFAAVVPAFLNAYASPPGANDWSCTPDAAYPEPVILVRGLGANRNDNWQTFAPLLANEGYCVYALTYGTQPGATYPLDQVGAFGPIESRSG